LDSNQPNGVASRRWADKKVDFRVNATELVKRPFSHYERQVGMIIVIMGVAGAGKTTIGQMLANRLRCPLLEGDALHPAANIQKMSRGIPLTDEDRQPWLAAIRSHMEEAANRHADLVVACSALKQQYRDFLSNGLSITWVYLKGSAELIRSRLEQRKNHYMKPEMLDSQLEILEEPADAIVVDVAPTPAEIVNRILAQLPRAA
jgi:gluconokinase